MNAITVGDEELISTTQAAEVTGYTKDYVGQLCREDKIECRRVSGHWYIQEDSLRTYKRIAEGEAEPKEQPQRAPYGMKVGNIRNDTFVYDDIQYIATSRASDVTGYAQDYIGQLARNGEVKARKIGRRWFVAKQMLLDHKKKNDDLLATVQAESAGLNGPVSDSLSEEEIEQSEERFDQIVREEIQPGNINFNVRYFSESDAPLVPKLRSQTQEAPVIYPPDDIPEKSAEQEKVVLDTLTPLKKETKSVEISRKNVSRTDHITPKIEVPDSSVRRPVSKQYTTERVAFNPKVHTKKQERNRKPLLLSVLVVLCIAISLASALFFIDTLSFNQAKHTFSKVSASTFQKIVPHDFIPLLRERFGDVMPGREVEYISK